MMKHCNIWHAIDFLAEQQGLSVAQLSLQAQLDRTMFAKSKRWRDGRPRWFSAESLSCVLEAKF